MRYALIITLGVTYYAGWLPASFVVPALLVFSVLRVPSRSGGQTPRRGGFIQVPPSASAGENPGMVNRVLTYTDSSRAPGLPSEVRTAFTTPLGLSKTSGPGSYMSAWGFTTPGLAGTDADRPVQVDIYGLDGAHEHSFTVPPGDCGCGDTAA